MEKLLDQKLQPQLAGTCFRCLNFIWPPGCWDTEALRLSIIHGMAEQSRGHVDACLTSPILFGSNLCPLVRPLQMGWNCLSTRSQDLSATNPDTHVRAQAGHGESKLPCLCRSRHVELQAYQTGHFRAFIQMLVMLASPLFWVISCALPLQVIAELDEKKQEALQKTWTEVNQKFGSIFSTLLPGTSAKLEPSEGRSFLDGMLSFSHLL